MKLRKATNAGMMDCKHALQEAEGDFDKAVDIIRKKGLIVASKRADRDAKEGCVLAKTDGKNAVMVSLNCETDFVAKNEGFINFTTRILDAALANMPASTARKICWLSNWKAEVSRIKFPSKPVLSERNWN